jgi:hypothetical protein
MWAPAAFTSDPDPGEEVAYRQFQAALVGGNPREVRRAAAALPRLSLADDAAILLVIERTEPENYERTALRWLARLAGEAPHGDLRTTARAAVALAALPSRPAARAELAGICHQLGLHEAAEVFARDHEEFARERARLGPRGESRPPGPVPARQTGAGPNPPPELARVR